MDLSSLYKAAKNCNEKVLDSFVANGGDINASLVLSGPQAGYTALHFAVLKKNKEHVLRLIKNHKAKVDSMGADGAEPLHLAYLLEDKEIAGYLLEAGANPDVELTKELVQKYIKHWKWRDDFGDTITLLKDAVSKGRGELVKCLLKYKANFGIKDTNNKTLLMYAIEYNHFYVAELLLVEMGEHQGLINARDNKGWHAVHYLLPSKSSGQYWYNSSMLIINHHHAFLEKLIRAGGDFNATVDGDPDTLLINLAAYRSDSAILKTLFNIGIVLNENSKPLTYATLPIDPEKFVPSEARLMMTTIKVWRNMALRCILEDMSFRREFGLFVPEEEINLMDHLVATNEKINKIVSNYQKVCINGILKNEILRFGDQSMTIYDLVVKVFDDKILKQMVKNHNFVKACKKFSTKHIEFKCNQIGLFREIMMKKVTTAEKRLELWKKVEKIEALRKTIPLPYEVILMIIEYVDNKSLENFIEAFY